MAMVGAGSFWSTAWLRGATKEGWGPNPAHRLGKATNLLRFIPTPTHSRNQGAFGSGSTKAKAKTTPGPQKKLKTRAKPSMAGKSAVLQQTEQASQLQGTQQPNCAWQAYITGKQYNLATPDMQAVYQV